MLKFLFGFHGRVSLAKFWAFYIVASICWGIAVLTVYGIADHAGIPDPLDDLFSGQPLSAGQWYILSPLAVVFAFLVVFFLAAMSKRLHDRNRSAWWLAAVYGCFFLAGALTMVLFATALAHGLLVRGIWILSMLVVGGAGLWLAVELFLLPGTRGDNRFGPDPCRIDRPEGAA